MIKTDTTLKILIALPSDALGGAEQFLKILAKYFSNNGNIVYVLFLKRKKFLGWEDIERYPNVFLLYGKYESERMGVFSSIKKIRKLKNETFDYTFTSHIHLTGFIGTIIRLRLLRTRFFVGRESTSVFSRFTGVKLLVFKFFYRIGFPKLDLLICQTKFMKEQLVMGLPKLQNKIKIKVIPNPIDLNDIQVQSKENIDTSIFGDYIVSAGRLIHLKGYDLLIEAFSNLKYKGLNLLILGEGKERSALQELIDRNNLGQRVILFGRVENVYPYFKNAKACAISSRIEGFPNVLLQMMSQNTKVISTTCAGGIEDIPGVSTCNTEDVLGLRDSIDKCLTFDTEMNNDLFETFLKQRSIANFVDSVEEEL